MTEIHFSSYRTSTITCNANIGSGININLDILFDNINIKEECFDDKEGIVWIQYVIDAKTFHQLALANIALWDHAVMFQRAGTNDTATDYVHWSRNWGL